MSLDENVKGQEANDLSCRIRQSFIEMKEDFEGDNPCEFYSRQDITIGICLLLEGTKVSELDCTNEKKINCPRYEDRMGRDSN